jgi:hypothetical protein
MSYNNQHLNIKQSKQPSSRWDIYQGVWFLDKMELYATMCHNIIMNSSLDW